MPSTRRRTRQTEEDVITPPSPSPPPPTTSTTTSKQTKQPEEMTIEPKHAHPVELFADVHHVCQASPLSKESVKSQNYRGLFNLAMLMLGVLNLRLIIENYMKYGWLFTQIDPASALAVDRQELQSLIGSFLIQLILVLCTYSVEYIGTTVSVFRSKPGRLFVRLVHLITIIYLSYVVTLISWKDIANPVLSALPLFIGTILLLKIISFILVRRYHVGRLTPHDDGTFQDTWGMCQLKDATVGQYVYFLFAPTLSYQPTYPRNPERRLLFVLKRCTELSVSLAGMYFMGAQYMVPTLQNSLTALDGGNPVRLLERLLKLSIVSVVMWLLMFWSFFHCWLNIVAELMRFGDRHFYEGWWNAKSIAEYWRLWNIPVYKWGKRHIFVPLRVDHKVSPFVASLVVFTISAFLHEILIGIPLKSWKWWAFAAMLGQIPLITINDMIAKMGKYLFPEASSRGLFDTLGNYYFWLTFTIVGQPACILLYYSHWYHKHYGTMSS